jgi:polygalacturonase
MKRVLTLCVLLAGSFLTAQDSRAVTEPAIPQPCVSLEAKLTMSGDHLNVADESKLDTARIQQAIDECASGHAVVLKVREQATAFLSGPLTLRQGVTLVVDRGATLLASRNPTDYETEAGSCGLVNESKAGCRPLISVQHISGAGVMGEGVIDGRGGEKLIGRDFSWWDLAEKARAGGRQQVPRLIVAESADSFTIYLVTLRNSPNFHVVYNHGDGFTVWALKIDTPKRLARNSDGVDPGSGSKNITITHSFIRTGDDNVAIKGGPGGVTHMTISHNHFYWGHGMSIGSETDGGVSSIRIFDLSLDGPDNGIRIKSNGSRGGLVQDVVYDDVCVRNSAHPITFDTAYTAAGMLKGDSPPTMRDITLHNVRISGGGKISFNGYAKDYRIGANLDGVTVADTELYSYDIHHADLKLGPGPVNLRLEGGVDSTLRGKAGSGVSASCADKFIAFPLVGLSSSR